MTPPSKMRSNVGNFPSASARSYVSYEIASMWMIRYRSLSCAFDAPNARITSSETVMTRAATLFLVMRTVRAPASYRGVGCTATTAADPVTSLHGRRRRRHGPFSGWWSSSVPATPDGDAADAGLVHTHWGVSPRTLRRARREWLHSGRWPVHDRLPNARPPVGARQRLATADPLAHMPGGPLRKSGATSRDPGPASVRARTTCGSVVP